MAITYLKKKKSLEILVLPVFGKVVRLEREETLLLPIFLVYGS